MLLLDTHVWLWYVQSAPEILASPALALIEKASIDGQLALSTISVWEVAMLHAKRRIRIKSEFDMWFAAALQRSAVQLFPLSADDAIESTRLPGGFHNDPADRMIVAAARNRNIMLVTRDEKILEYGRAGFVKVLTA